MRPIRVAHFKKAKPVLNQESKYLTVYVLMTRVQVNGLDGDIKSRNVKHIILRHLGPTKHLKSSLLCILNL